jgi:hypothetical protein
MAEKASGTPIMMSIIFTYLLISRMYLNYKLELSCSPTWFFSLLENSGTNLALLYEPESVAVDGALFWWS